MNPFTVYQRKSAISLNVSFPCESRSGRGVGEILENMYILLRFTIRRNIVRTERNVVINTNYSDGLILESTTEYLSERHV